MNNEKVLKRNILEWLSIEGYTLEMKVATSFRKHGFNVIQHYFYSDPENGNSREVDVVATISNHTGNIDISFIIECISLKENPWILFTSSHVLEDVNMLYSYCINSDSVRKTLINKEIQTVLSLPWMKKRNKVAYCLTEAFTTDYDITYKASINVLKGAISRKRILESTSLVFIFPAIVIDGKAFECFIDEEDEEIIILEFNRGFYFCPLKIDGEFGTCIQILTVDKLDEFIKEAKEVANSIFDILEEGKNGVCQ
jgi:hypothetical protein